MLTDEEREQLLCDVGCTGEHSRYCAAAMPGVYRVQMEADDLTERVESIVAARVCAARAQERQQVIDELHGFLPEWNYPAHVIAAISLELRDRANHIESSHNG